jgi:hypothetical protein
MIVKTKSLFILLSINLIFITSCRLFDDNDSGTDCLYDYITVENKCDQDVIVSYNDQPEEFDWVEFIIGIDFCDVIERNEVIIPGEEKDIYVFLGTCSKSEEAFPSDSCDGFGYWSDESITVQYGEAVRDIYIYSNSYIELSPEDFD